MLRIRQADPRFQRAAMEDFVSRYWKPVYCYVRRRGASNEQAKDLTQGFFLDVVLGRALIQELDRGKGRLRSLLLTALNHYVTSVHRAETARKRMPSTRLLRLERISWLDAPKHVSGAGPEEAFNYAWASALLDQVLADVDAQCRGADKSIHWEVFCARVLHPLLHNSEPPSLEELCAEHGIATEARASNMIITVKRRFQATLRRYVRQFVHSDDEVDEEIGELMQILSRRGGRA